MKIKLYRGYWTIFAGDEPALSFASLRGALAMLRDDASTHIHFPHA